MPAQQGCRLDEEAPETLAGEQSCESGQDRPIRRLERRSMDLAPEDRHLVAEHDDLDGEIRVTATDQSDELEEAAERPVEEREGHRRMLAAMSPGVKVLAHRPWMAFSAPTPEEFVGRARRSQSRHRFTPIPWGEYPAVQAFTAKSFQLPGTPFSSCSPRSTNSMPEPTTRSRTVLETTISPVPASACSPALRCGRPGRRDRRRAPRTHRYAARSEGRLPLPAVACRMLSAQRMARAGPSKQAKNPSPVVLISRPRETLSSSRTILSWVSSSVRQRVSPSDAARSVEPTMSEKSTVVSTRSTMVSRVAPVKNRATSSLRR